MPRKPGKREFSSAGNYGFRVIDVTAMNAQASKRSSLVAAAITRAV
jgi:hypothetical protein